MTVSYVAYDYIDVEVVYSRRTLGKERGFASGSSSPRCFGGEGAQSVTAECRGACVNGCGSWMPQLDAAGVPAQPSRTLP